MNSGGTLPKRDEDDADLGGALHHRLSQLAARLERLAKTAPANVGHGAGRQPPALDDAEKDDADDEPPALPPARGDAPEMSKIANALRDLDKKPATAVEPDRPLPVGQAPDQDPDTRLAAIRKRIDALRSRRDEPDFHKRPPEAAPPPKPQPAPAAAPRAAMKAPAEAPRAMSSSAKAPAGKAGQPVNGPDLADVISELVDQAVAMPAKAAPADKSKPAAPDASGLGQRLDEIRDLVRGGAGSNRLTAIEASQTTILQRLDQMMQSRADDGFDRFTKQILERLPSAERFDTMSVELDRLSERVATLDHREQLGKIEQRLSTFEEKLTAPPSADHAASPQIEASLSALQESLGALTRMLNEDGPPSFARLEERLNQVSARFEETLENAPRAESVANLFERLETLAARGEAAPPAIEALAKEVAEIREREHSQLQSLDAHIQTLAQRLEEAIGGKVLEQNSLSDLESRIATLSTRLNEIAAAGPDQEHLAELRQVETQIAELSGRIDQLDAGEGATAGLAALELQVTDLMSRLEQLSTDHTTLEMVQEHLARLEAVVSDSGEASPDAIRQAAREAVSELSNIGAGRPGSAALDGLKSDLVALQRATQESDRETGQSLDKVNKTLDRVVARLTGLEQELRSQPADRAPREASRRPGGAEAAADDAGVGEPIPPQQSLVAEAESAVPGEDRERRADFIAAARRAAQAAAAEHAMQQRAQHEDEDDEDRPRGRFRQMISDHRRPLIIATGAVVLTIAVLTILQPFGGSGASAPQQPAPIVDPAPEPAPPAPEALLIDPAPAAPAMMAPAFAEPQVPAGPPAAAAGAAPAGDLAATYPMPEEAVGSLRLRAAAAAGDPSALFEVGARYADGRFVDVDIAEAVIWFERAAEAGLAVAQYRLAMLYEAGIGIPADRQLAADWYMVAAEQGNVMAMHNLGVLLSQGIGDTPDFAGAIEWFTAAADHGIRDSQYNLGVIFARGIGTEADLVASYQWFALAAAQGDTDAAARRDDVAATLSADQLAAARAAVAAWSVAGAPAEANGVAIPDGGWDPADERVEAGDHLELVRTIQALLIERGYDPGPADGVEGPMTTEAVRAFQENLGLDPTGEIDQTLLDALMDLAA